MLICWDGLTKLCLKTLRINNILDSLSELNTEQDEIVSIFEYKTLA